MASSKLSSFFKGTRSPEYVVVQGHFYNLVSLFQDSLSQLATQFYSVKLISSIEYDNALGNQPAFDRAASTLRSIQKRIEYETKWYCKFVEAMDQFPFLEDLVKKIESDFKRERETCEREFVPGKLPDVNNGMHRQRSFSDSNVFSRSKSGSSNNSDKDSAYFEPLSLANADDNNEFEDLGSQSVSRKNSRILDRAQSMYGGGALVLAGHGSGVTFEVPPSEPTSSDENSTWVTDSSKARGHGQAEIVAPASSISERSINRACPQHSHFQLKICSLEKVKSELEITIQYLKKEHIIKESDLLKQKDVVSTKLKVQQGLVKDRENIIENLKADQDIKDTQIKDLRKKKEDLEDRIKVLKQERDKAKENVEAAEQRVVAVEKEFKKREQDLLKELETVKKSEGEAVIKLNAIKQQLAEAMLVKEKERSEYREKNHELEKKQLVLESEIKHQELSHAKELAEKETQLAKTKEDLAESKTRCMEMKVEAMNKEMEALKLQLLQS